MHAVIQEARLLTYNEATEFGCKPYDCPTGTEEKSFVSNTSFWLGTAYNSSQTGIQIGYILTPGILTSRNYYDDGDCGIRPVIVVNTSDIEI